MAAVVQIKTPFTRYERIRQAREKLEAMIVSLIEQTNGNLVEAKAALLVEIEHQPEAAEILDALVDMASETMLTEAQREWRRQNRIDHRAEVVSLPVPQRQSSPAERVQALASSNLAMLLPNGKQLGDALGGDVLEAMTIYERQGRTLMQQSRWLNAIANGLKPGQKVREAFSEEQLAAMRRRVSD